MSELNANVRAVDHARAHRLTLAWSIADEESFHLTMHEIITDRDAAAVPGVLFASVALSSRTSVAAMPDDYADVLRAGIIEWVKRQHADDE